MKFIYAAIIRKDEEDPKWWNVSIPDVWGAVTCGDSFENAVFMAHDLLKVMSEASPRAFGHPTPIEETKENFPGEQVVPIEVELKEVKDYPELAKKKRNRKVFTVVGDKTYEVIGSLMDYRLSRVFEVDDKHHKTIEVTDKDKKYFILQIARNDIFEKLMGEPKL